MMFSQKLNIHRIVKGLAKALISLRVCAGWSEPLLVAHTILLEISCYASYMYKDLDQLSLSSHHQCFSCPKYRYVFAKSYYCLVFIYLVFPSDIYGIQTTFSRGIQNSNSHHYSQHIIIKANDGT